MVIVTMSHKNVQPHVSINEVACYRSERTLMGFAEPPSKGVGAPHQCSRVNEHQSGWRKSALATEEAAAAAVAAMVMAAVMEVVEGKGLCLQTALRSEGFLRTSLMCLQCLYENECSECVCV